MTRNLQARVVALFIVVVCLGNGASVAQDKKLGVGVVLGLPTGFSAKYWQSPALAYQGVLGGAYGGLAVGGDYLVHSKPFKDPDLAFYYGPGVFVGGAKRTGASALAVRGAFGLTYIFPRHPFDVAVEVSPVLFLTPLSGVAVTVGLAFRFYP